MSIVHEDPNLNHLVIFNLFKLWYESIFIFLMHLDFSTSFFELCITLKQWSQTPINKKGEGQFVFLRYGLYFQPQHGIILLHSSCPRQSNHTRASVLQSWSTNYKLANSCWYNQLKICFLCSNNINNYKDTTIIHKSTRPLSMHVICS
jgi:hypothetical protein